MLRVNVSIGSISAERFWDLKKPAPNIQINTNINVVSVEKTSEDSLDVPFVLTISYNPSVAQISLKGNAYVQGEPSEIENVLKEYDQKKPPPPLILQSISNVVFVESILLSRTLNIPPPIPLPMIQQSKPPSSKPASRDYSA